MPRTITETGCHGFDELWSRYPRRVAKLDAMKAFRKLNPNADLLARMLAALEWQTRSPQWTKDGGQYVPYLATWIRSARWDDEPTVRTPSLQAPTWTSKDDEEYKAMRARVIAEQDARARALSGRG